MKLFCRRRRTTFSTVVLAAMATCNLALAVPGPSAPDALAAEGGARLVTSVEGVSEYSLSNGMHVLLIPDDSASSTTVNVTYFVGSRQEGYGETGMAHLLEHLMFKGTPSHPEITQEISRRGGSANGTTNLDRTNYFQTFPFSEENLSWSLKMEADRMVNSDVSAEDLASEMTVVRNEWERGENSPSGVLGKRSFAAAFQWHGYGRSTIGERSDIENVPIGRLQSFYRKYYQPDNALLVVAGKFDPTRTLALAQSTFGAIPLPERQGDNTLYATYTREPAQDGERSVVLRRVGAGPQVMMLYHIPAAAHPDFAALDLLGHVLSDPPGGRLYKALVETGKATSVAAGAEPSREPGVLVVQASVAPGQSTEEAQRILEDVVENLASKPPTEAETARARNGLLAAFRLGMTDTAGVAVSLSDWAAYGDWRLLFLHRDRLRATNAKQVLEVASKYLQPSNRTVGLFVPEPDARRVQVPEAPDLAASLAGYRGDKVPARTASFDPTPEEIEKRLLRGDLPGGAKFALLPKPTRGGTVYLKLVLRLGTPETLKGRKAEGEMAGAMLGGATRRHSRQQMTDELARLDAQIAAGGDSTHVSLDIQTVRENLPAAVALGLEMLREPAFEQKDFDEARSQIIAGLENQKSDPGALAGIALERQLAPWPVDHPLYTGSSEENLQAFSRLSLDGVKSFADTFYGAGPGTTISVLGDFDPVQIKKLLARSLAAWAPRQRFVRVPAPTQPAPGTRISIETPDKSNATLLAGLNMPMREDDPDYPAMALANFMLGGGFLHSRFADRIRQQEGLSYSVGSQLSAHPIDARAEFRFTSIFAPENANRVEAAFKDELAKALDKGFTAEELEQAKVAWLQARQLARGTDAQLLSAINSQLYLNRTMKFGAQVDAQVAALTPADVLRALRKHLDPSRITIVEAGDFHAAAARVKSP